MFDWIIGTKDKYLRVISSNSSLAQLTTRLTEIYLCYRIDVPPGRPYETQTLKYTPMTYTWNRCRLS